MKLSYLRPLAALLVPLTIATPAWGKGRTVRIALTCEGLKRPVELADTNSFALDIQQGPWGARFMDRAAGAVSAPDARTRLCQVSFYVRFGENGERDTRLAYVIYYRYDPQAPSQGGYVYLPGPSDPWHALNSSTLTRAGLDGTWQHAARSWEDAIRTAIEHATV